MLTGEKRQLFLPSGHITTNGIVHPEGNQIRHPTFLAFELNGLADFLKSLDGFGGLGEEIDGTGYIQTLQILLTLYHYGRVGGLSHQPVHLCMPGLSVDDHLTSVGEGFFVGRMHLILQMQHHRTGSIGDAQSLFPGFLVGFRRFSVRTDHHPGRLERTQSLMVDGLHAQSVQTRHLLLVVDNIAQTVERGLFLQLLLCHPDGTNHPVAKT